jgi:hypothetical protein
MFLANLYAVCEEQKITKPEEFPSFDPDNIDRVKAYLEYAFGRDKRIDLVIQVWMKEGSHLDFVIEAKVDGAPSHGQIETSRTEYTKQMSQQADSDDGEEKSRHTRNAIAVLSLLGASHICHDWKRAEGQLTYAILGPKDWSCLVPTCTDPFVLAWKHALDRELWMIQNVRKAFVEWERDKDPGEIPRYFEHRSHARCLYAYDSIRNEEFKGFGEWTVFASSNNPILNRRSDLVRRVGDLNLSLYWEMNWSAMKLKVEVNGEGDRDAAV